MTVVSSPRIGDLSNPFVSLTMRRRQRDTGVIVYPNRVRRVSFKDTSRKSTNRLMIVLDNRDGLLYGDDLLMRKGTLIGFKFGYPGYNRDAGDFVIKKRKPNGGSLELECHEAKRNKHSRKPNTRQWTNAKFSDVVRHMLARMGFSGSLVEISESELVRPIVTQFQLGDYQFIEELADEESKEFWIDDDGAHWIEPKRNHKPSNKYKYKKGLIGVGNVVGEPEIEDFGSSVPGRIRARGIDPLTGEEFTVSASDSEDPEEDVRGLVKLADTDTMMTPEDGDASASGNDGHEIEINIGSRSKAEAKVAVDTLYKKYRYGALKVKIPLIGDPFLFPRTVSEVWGIGPAVDGYFWVKEVNHELSANGPYRTTVELNKDGLNKKKKPAQESQPDYDSLYGRG